MKGLLHFAPHSKTQRGFDDRLREIAGELALHPDASTWLVTPMFRLDEDPFGAATRWRGTLEIRSPVLDEGLLGSLFASHGDALREFADLDQSSLLLGEDVEFIASEHAPVRYQYAMRRNTRFDHASYLKRYREVHSRFGLETPGILGYTQFHVDLEASHRAATQVGIGIWDVDSVSELHLASLEVFLSEIAKSNIGGAAIADEKVFVDRANSHDFCSRVEWPQ